LTDQQFSEISKMVYDHCKINLHEGKKELVRARLAKRLRVGGFASYPEYMRHVLSDETGHEFSILIDSLSTNLTSFFRENQHFEFLRKTLLPQLLARKQTERSFKIRCWSAGCSSGEEPYSLAITLLDETSGKGRWDVKILASDISTTVLDRARQGVYPKERIEPVSAAQRSRYLTKRRVKGEEVYEVNSPLREAVVFKHVNLMEAWPIRVPLDFIFCRNVMIYFDKPTQECLVNRYWEQLDVGGALFTGHSESLTGVKHKFKYVQPTIYRKA
jgi:chemotaxis protein methyltransferase CheR